MLLPVVLIFCALTFVGVRTQAPCVPNPVGELELSYDGDGMLTWSPSENCPDTIYRIHIKVHGTVRYEYTVTSQNLSLDFLPYCWPYNFTVAPIADTVLGMENWIEDRFHIPNGTDVAIESLRAVPIERNILVDWKVDPKYTTCVSYYHLVIHHDGAEAPENLHVWEEGYLVQAVAHCTHYKFEVKGYYDYDNTEGTGKEIEYTVPPATNTPSLVEVRQDSTSINTTWRLERYFINRCQVTALYVNGTRFNAAYPVEDTPDRLDIPVSVTGLKPDSMYYFNVTTENSFGVSAPYQIGVQTLQ